MLFSITLYRWDKYSLPSFTSRSMIFCLSSIHVSLTSDISSVIKNVYLFRASYYYYYWVDTCYMMYEIKEKRFLFYIQHITYYITRG